MFGQELGLGLGVLGGLSQMDFMRQQQMNQYYASLQNQGIGAISSSQPTVRDEHLLVLLCEE